VEQLVMTLRWPEALMCPSWVLIQGRRVQCERHRHRPADGSTCLDWHHASFGACDREAWTDDEEHTEMRDGQRARRRAM